MSAGELPLLASASDDEVALWEHGVPSPLANFQPHAEPITCLRWTSNDRVLASSSHDGTIALSEVSGRLFHSLEAMSSSGAPVEVLTLTWSPGSRYLAAGGSDAIVRIFDLQKRSQALTLRGHKAAVRGVAWSPSEVYVASCSASGDTIVHRVQGSVAAVARVHHPPSVAPSDAGAPPALTALQWSPFHPSLLAVAAADGTVAVWEIRPAVATSEPRHVFSERPPRPVATRPRATAPALFARELPRLGLPCDASRAPSPPAHALPRPLTTREALRSRRCARRALRALVCAGVRWCALVCAGVR